MKTFIGDFEVLGSGTISSFGLQDIRFVMHEDPLVNVLCRVVPDASESSLDLKVLSPDTIAMIFSNPGSVDLAPAEPVKVGFLDGRYLHASFRVSMRDGNSSYILSYTFYLGGTV